MSDSTSENGKEVLAQVRNLSVVYHTRRGPLSAVEDVSFDLYRGEIIGLVGESGSGKSTLGKALLRMIEPPGEITGGEVIFKGENIMAYDYRRLREFRGQTVSMIFQDPLTSLNPVQRVDQHLIEAQKVHQPETPIQTCFRRARNLVERLRIPRSRLYDYPHQLSGGMRQRVMISLGMVLNADLIVADEATTSLDVIVEANLLDELRQIRDQFGVTILMITHNIALVAEVADRIAVMYAGQLAELGSVYDVFDRPLHPYTKGLLNSVPSIALDEKEELYRMPGEPPNMTHPPSGCRFNPRCPYVMDLCDRVDPDLLEAAPGQLVHCWLYQEHPEKEAPTIKVVEP
jgi:oligopeptide/dipeptide ABC transporter ATP-binding protein